MFKSTAVIRLKKSLQAGSMPVSIDTREWSASYYWLVILDNGMRVPYPLFNQEGVTSTPFKYGDIKKSLFENKIIEKQEKIISQFPLAVEKFKELQKDFF